MKKLTLTLGAATLASPALAASGPFFSLGNSDFVVSIAFILFIGILVYFKVPRTIMSMLDKRAEGIQANLSEARTLREEAQTLLASYERKQNEVKEQADRIVAAAKDEAESAATKARADLEHAIQRRLKAAEEQIESAQADAVKEVRDRAIQVAVAAAADVLAKDMDSARAAALIDSSIETVQAKLH
ncbi:F0F1 ATP synthase subunit B [Oceaniglobus ichthyenteri]|uniref:F0F1 ATP synthase subunit B n=1 Tax=Oceaniglobus ichthyenteri TaxID=2136177 RepID=UPI000D36B8DC|nr:F0F1 ATP synthase subunit B [Oceaniglobus ichthyenteri]